MGEETYKENYEFIPINNSAKYYKCSEKEKTNCGYIDLKCTAVTEIHIGSGNFGMVGETFCKLTEKVNGRYVIPGSSIKGCVRNIAGIVADGCVKFQPKIKEKMQKKRITYECNMSLPKARKNNTCYIDRHCIVCDMFGMLGPKNFDNRKKGALKSRIYFDDFIADEGIYSVSLSAKQPFGPMHSGFSDSKDYDPENENKYQKIHCTYKGYKLYPTNIPRVNLGEKNRIFIEALPKKTVFSGRINFERISDEELSLLLFSLGLDKSFDLKIGGFKAENFGVCRMECIDFKLNDEKKSKSFVSDLARKYAEDNTANENINQLRTIMKPKKDE